MNNKSLIEVLKHIFSHKSLKVFGYKLMLIRLLYAMVYPFVIIWKVFKFLFKPQKEKVNK